MTICRFCNTEYADGELARCPNCGMREEYAQEGAVDQEKRPFQNPFRLFLRGMTRYARLRGRAARTEYASFIIIAFILWALFAGIGVYLAETTDGRSFPNIETAQFVYVGSTFLLGLVLFLPPTVSIVVRRLHDLGFSGWHFFSILAIQSIFQTLGLELFTVLIPLTLFLWRGSRGDNEYGADPRRE